MQSAVFLAGEDAAVKYGLRKLDFSTYYLEKENSDANIHSDMIVHHILLAQSTIFIK